MSTADPPQVPSTQGSWIGKSVRRHEDARLVKGAGRFVDDVDVFDQLHCALVGSTIAHGRIRSIDMGAARSMAGVVRVVSGAEVRDLWEPLISSGELPGARVPTMYALATDKVHFYGEPVAAVVASSPEIAEDAAARVQVEYEPLPPIVSVQQALADSPTLLHEDWPDNIQFEWQVAIGDVNKALSEADLVVKEVISSHRYSGVPLETRAVLADFDAGTGELTVRMSTQVPHQVNTIIARLLRIPESSVRVLADELGGGFGNKLFHDVEYIPILLSMLIGRPVKWVESRAQSMTNAPHARDHSHAVEAGFTADGRLTVLRDALTVDLGCDGMVRGGGLPTPLVAGIYGPGPYKLNVYANHVRAVVTNKAPYGAYRGFGKDTANLAMERVMDLAAARLAIDPVEIRRRNLVEAFPYQLCTGPIIESGSFIESLDVLVDNMDLAVLRSDCEAARRQGRFRGVGVVSFLEPSGGSVPGTYFSGFESATVRVAPSGAITVLTGTQQCGQGMQTTLAQVAASSLGCDPANIKVICGDTNATPYGLGAYSSRGAMFGATAVHLAAAEVRDKLLIAAGNLLEADRDDLELINGAVRVRGSSEVSMLLATLAECVYFNPGPYVALANVTNPTLEATASWTNPAVSWTPDEFGRIRVFPAHGGGAHGALIEVDGETGQITVEHLWVTDDVGTMINPMIVEGQVHGGTVQGLGGALYEGFSYDDQGRPEVHTYRDYGIPNIASVPRIDVVHLQTPSTTNPLGTKGAGEAGTIGTPTCLMAAVEDALRPLDIKVLNLPLSPPRVLAAIEAARAGQPASI